MKKIFVLSLVIIIAALSVIAVSAAPRAGYYDQVGNKHWCNSDSYGCWVTGEDGGKDYIMFWSESAAEAIMGKNSGAPIGTLPGTSELNLAAPIIVVAEEGGDGKDPEPAPSPEPDLCPFTEENCKESENYNCYIQGTGEACQCLCNKKEVTSID